MTDELPEFYELQEEEEEEEESEDESDAEPQPGNYSMSVKGTLKVCETSKLHLEFLWMGLGNAGRISLDGSGVQRSQYPPDSGVPLIRNKHTALVVSSELPPNGQGAIMEGCQCEHRFLIGWLARC